MLRLGCLGCLATIVLALVLAGAVWSVVQISRVPEVVPVPITASDGVRAQQKVFDLLRRSDAGRASATSLSERELNALVRRHLEDAADLPLRELTIRLPGEARADIVGHASVGQLCASPPFSALASVLPFRVLEHRVWVTVLAHVAVETPDAGRARRRVRLDVTRLYLGRLRLPAVMLRVLLDPSALSFLRWPLPPSISELRIEPGRLILQTGP